MTHGVWSRPPPDGGEVIARGIRDSLDLGAMTDRVTQPPAQRPGSAPTAPSSGTSKGARAREPAQLSPFPYVIERKIGSGGMGVVYEGVDVERQRRVAIKQLPAVDADALLRFKSEFRVVADLSHPNLVTLHELISVDDTWMIVMELIRGDSLRTYLAHAADNRWETMRRVFAKLARAVAALHEARVLHLDIKPANVQVEPSGRVVLLDFGLAQVVPRAPAAERARRVAGTAEYLAPEQARGESPRPASDWYAFGVVLYEMLTGQLPFDGPNAKAIFHAKIAGDGGFPSRIDSSIPMDLDTLCEKLLRRTPGERPAADEIIAALGPSSGVVERGPRWTPPPNTQALVGRGREMAQLQDGYVAWAGEQLSVVLIEGAHGIGKSRVIERFGEWAAAQADALVIAARCDAREAVPFRGLDGVVDALARALVKGGLEVPLDVVRPAARLFPVLARLLPDAQSPLDDPEEARRRGAVALAQLLRAVASQRRLVITIDDLHLGDEDSAALLTALLSGPEAPPVLLVVSLADGDDGSPMVRELRRAMPSAPSVWLAPLGAESAEVLARALLPGESAEVLSRVAVASGGHPMVLEQLAAERGAGFRALDELTPSSTALLSVVAVAGRAIPQGLAATVADLGGEQAGAVASLRAARLVRVHGARESDAVDCSSERLRNAVLERLSTAQVVRVHRRLAERLEDDPSASPDELAQHWIAAGDPARAGGWTHVAADRAARALAFEQASALYARAIELGVADAEVFAKRAAVLAQAGRRGEAARTYLDASRRAVGARKSELAARAAEELMLNGEVDEAADLLRSEFGLSWPSTARGRLTSTLGRMLALGPRVLTLSPRRESSASPEALAHVDLLFAAAKGFVTVEPSHSQWFGVACLSEAMRAGEPLRLGRSLAVVGAALASSDTIAAWWGRQMMARAVEIRDLTQDAYLSGLIALADGHLDLDAGRWSVARAKIEAGVHTLRTHCQGVEWECAVGEIARLRILEELGDYRGVASGAAVLGARARTRGDRYTALIAQRFEAFAALVAGDVARARSEAAAVRETWSTRAVHIQLLYALQVEAACDLYEGDAAAARARVEEAWAGLEGSGIFGLSSARADAEVLRAQTSTLALLASGGAAGVPKVLARAGLAKREDVAGVLALLESNVRPRAAEEAHGRLAAGGRAALAAVAAGDHAALAACGVADPARWMRLWRFAS